MKLEIVRAGRYNDAHGISRAYAAGDSLETSLEYGQSLVASGYARPAEAAQPAPQSTPRRKKAASSAA